VAATINFQVLGLGKTEAQKIRDAVADAIGSRPGRWHVQFIGNLGEEVWEMRVSGPGVEASEYLDHAAGQHKPDYIADLLQRVAQ
jgi:hypothetical protein